MGRIKLKFKANILSASCGWIIFVACAMSTPVWVLVWECVYVTGLLAVGPEWDPELLFARMHRTCFCVTNIQKVECERAREIERSQRKREI